jgi:glycosyltransferase involved in cell wall biosynthesis
MEEAELLVLPSRSETFGRVIAEAQLHALPTVATRVGALPEIVEEGITGRLVAPEDAHSLAHAILELAADGCTRAEMGRRARERALLRFAFWRVIGQQVLVYRAVADRLSPHPILEKHIGRALAG